MPGLLLHGPFELGIYFRADLPRRSMWSTCVTVLLDENMVWLFRKYIILILIQDCFLPKGSYAYPSSVINFLKWNLYRKAPLCLNKQNVWTYKLRKVYCFKRLWLERNDWIWLHLFINADASFMTYFSSYKQTGHFTGRETAYCNLNSNMIEGVGCPVLATR